MRRNSEEMEIFGVGSLGIEAAVHLPVDAPFSAGFTIMGPRDLRMF